MELFSSVVLFVLGFFLLIKGASWLVSGARSIARLFEISPWFIGLVIVGIGTSIPELSINIASVFEGSPIGLGTIIGSNTFNILVILGLSAVIAPVAFRREWVRRDLLLNLAAIGAAALAILAPVAGDAAWLGITRLEALALVALLIGWMWYMFHQYDTEEESAEGEVLSGFLSAVFIVAGVIGVFFGGWWVVDGAETFAHAIGVSPALIALSVVAAGTSLPELTVSIVALVRKQGSLAVGNVIGSNIFDFLGILGITALLRPIAVRESLQFDIFAAFGAALLLLVLVRAGSGGCRISRFEGIVMLAAYLIYLAIVLWRG